MNTRRIRYIPHPMLLEITVRVVGGRFLLPPSPRLNRLAIGVLARAQQMYGMSIHAFCLMSNHYHLLLTAQDALQLARFMNFVQSNLAREAGRLVNWRERFWARRYQAIPVSDEPDAQKARLRYILSQGCKEGLVSRPELWEGAHCVRELMHGESRLHGDWIDRTLLYRSSKSEPLSEADVTTEETLTLTPLPCFVGMSVEDRRSWIRECVESIASDAALAAHTRNRAKKGKGATRRDPNRRTPQRRSPAPWFHAASEATARALRTAYLSFLALYRAAATDLKNGLPATFPDGCFPPAHPFVGGVRRPIAAT